MKRNRITTVSAEEHILAEGRRSVGEGGYRSLSACVSKALRAFLAEERRRRLEVEMEEASHDEMFLADIQRTMGYFKHADAETARRMEER